MMIRTFGGREQLSKFSRAKSSVIASNVRFHRIPGAQTALIDSTDSLICLMCRHSIFREPPTVSSDLVADFDGPVQRSLFGETVVFGFSATKKKVIYNFRALARKLSTLSNDAHLCFKTLLQCRIYLFQRSNN